MKYSKYIELSPHYESVVDLDTDERIPGLWQEYIVHDDMKGAVKAICETMSWEDNDKRRSFWIHGAYGTGKSYAAIVLKHLFEDSVLNIKDFMDSHSLENFQKQFVKIREKGKFLVAWKSGTTDIKSGTHLMMEMEVTIKEKLKEAFGDKAYYGTSSLTDAAKDAINDPTINWNYIYTNSHYRLSDQYDDFDAFKQDVLSGDRDAINLVKQICEENKRAMFTGVVTTFKKWVQDIIEGNNLKDTGIVFIWDEFTGFLRDCGDDDVLRELSEFCKKAPFFMCLIVHRDPSWVSTLGDETYHRILHRYHELNFHITESATYDLIGNSILPRPGMSSQWAEVKNDLIKSIGKYKSEFDNLNQTSNVNERLAQLCPIHPMTISLLATVSEHFGASQRTLFRFMKDQGEASEGVGFIHYIENNEPNQWQWLTVDFLWDYFFMRSSDIHDFSDDTRKVIQYFKNKHDSISDQTALHLFKAALLLIAVMNASNISDLYSKQNRPVSRIGPTRNTLYKCFHGQLDEARIDEYLNGFKETALLSLSEQANDIRLELPYTGNIGTFEMRLLKTQKSYTRNTLFAKNGCFSSELENQMRDSSKAMVNRLYIAACSSDTKSLTARLGEVKDELKNFPYKIGILVVNVAERNEHINFQTKIKEYASEDTTGRLVIIMPNEPCTADLIDRWHRAFTHRELCAEDGKQGDASKYEREASEIVVSWAKSALNSRIFAYYGNIQLTEIHGKGELMKRIEKDVLYSVFTAAPERLVTVDTAYNKCTHNAVSAALTKEVKSTQINNIVEKLKTIGAWDVNDLTELKNLTGTNADVITTLATELDKQFAEGAIIRLDALWELLQKAPFGYYNSMTVGVFIGLAMRFLVNGSFNWFDGTNTLPPTEANLATMVVKILNNKAINYNLSSGSKIWQRFKPYIQKLFNLSDQEVINEKETRKFINQAIQTKVKRPIWALKYISAEKFGGTESQSIVNHITDLLVNFIHETTEDQEQVMNEIVDHFNGRGKLRQLITDTLEDTTAMASAFKQFMFTNVNEIEQLSASLDLSNNDTFDILKDYMQSAINTWQENQVQEKLIELGQELKVVSIIKDGTNENIKSYRSAQTVLNNVFGRMKIPGPVIETLPMSWIPALKRLREIAKEPWGTLPDKDNLAAILEGNTKTTWEHLTQQRLILRAVFNERTIIVTEEEFDTVYTALPSQAYETKLTEFDTKLNELLGNVKYSRDIKKTKELWCEKTRTANINEWCNKNNLPIVWLFEGSNIEVIRTIKQVQDDQTVQKATLANALTFLSGSELYVLQDPEYIAKRFFAYIGENYRLAFDTHGETLIHLLKQNSQLTDNVYCWENKIPELRDVLDTYLQKIYQEEAKEQVRSKMSEMELRDAVIRLLDKNPELYSYFIG
jgi:hypothetical protein